MRTRRDKHLWGEKWDDLHPIVDRQLAEYDGNNIVFTNFVASAEYVYLIERKDKELVT